MNRLFQALASAADGAFVINQEQHIIYWNQAAQEILGYMSAEIVDQPCYEILAGCDDQGRLICHEHCRQVVAALSGGTVTNLRMGGWSMNMFGMSTERFDRLTRRAVAVLVGAGVLAVSFTLYAVWPPNQVVGYEPDQPFVFSHAAMAGNSKIPCRYCHYAAESGPHAGIPAVSLS